MAWRAPCARLVPLAASANVPQANLTAAHMQRSDERGVIYDDTGPRCKSARLPGAEAHRGGGRVAQSQPPPEISVIAGACPMMFGPGADFKHRCMRWVRLAHCGLPA